MDYTELKNCHLTQFRIVCICGDGVILVLNVWVYYTYQTYKKYIDTYRLHDYFFIIFHNLLMILIYFYSYMMLHLQK